MSGKKDEHEWVIKDNLFHRRVSDIRNQVTWDFEQTQKAVDLLQSGNALGHNQQQGRELTEEEIEAIAFFDALTPNFKFAYMLRVLRRELKRAKRYGRPLSVLLVAFDGAMAIESRHGALAQDEVLRSAGATLNSLVRNDVDLVGRYLNERFVIVAPETAGKGAAILAERIRKKFESTVFKIHWHEVHLTTSIGIAYYPGHGDDAEELIVQADMATEFIERRGGNGIAYAPEQPQQAGT